MKKPAISTFLPVPYAPNYEINGKLKVRNKKSGRLRKASADGCVTFCVEGKTFHRSLAKAYRAALDNYFGYYDDSSWATCSRLKGLYEVNLGGEVRNAKTKHKLKPSPYNTYHLTIDGKNVYISARELLTEVFGVACRSALNAKKAVILRKDSFAQYCESMAAAARWLSKKVYYPASTLRTYMNKHPKELFGWQIEYLGRRKKCAISLKTGTGALG